MNTKFVGLVLAILVLGFAENQASAQQTDLNENAKQQVQPGEAQSEKAHLEKSLVRPKVIVFDVNETLLDLAPLKASVGKTLGGREDLLPL
ncbi:hypothetical protein [Novipirellula maiorica]|nr:hypothetical protein [Rhodopirellula maiorica]